MDHYRWLEDDNSKATADWVKSQNKVTYGYLDKIPYREALKSRLEAMWNYEKLSSPFIEGERTYYYKNDGLQNQYVLYRVEEDGEDEVFLDPNNFFGRRNHFVGGIKFFQKWTNSCVFHF